MTRTWLDRYPASDLTRRIIRDHRPAVSEPERVNPLAPHLGAARQRSALTAALVELVRRHAAEYQALLEAEGL